ncbi:MAG: hypothetical protein ACI8PZ_001365 [Myxococcota bacterium]|jgi:hypothetical protein
MAGVPRPAARSRFTAETTRSTTTGVRRANPEVAARASASNTRSGWGQNDINVWSGVWRPMGTTTSATTGWTRARWVQDTASPRCTSSSCSSTAESASARCACAGSALWSDTDASERTIPIHSAGALHDFEAASADTQIAVAAAALAEKLRSTPEADGWSWGRIQAIVRGAHRGSLEDDELVELVGRAQATAERHARR